MTTSTENGYRPHHLSHTVVAIVEDKPGVLMRVSSLFRRRGFNIESLTVGPTEEKGLSRITIVVDGESAPVEQVEKQLYKLIDVIKVSDLSSEDMVARELALIKVRANNLNRHEILEIASVFRADIVDMATGSVIIQVVGDEAKIDGLVKMLEPYGIRELSRTGRVAMVRGTKTTTVHEREPEQIARVHASQGRRVDDMELPFSSD
ncbi:MAG: acetolactate synthase small subunit [Dehalococcoidia bacterium]|nr:acetolactate synthase small subunit [Dehalococcoidia bacterium]MCB9486906.1 acetolactate synthase small subunit [Thermoflexaceae bacterium]